MLILVMFHVYNACLLLWLFRNVEMLLGIARIRLACVNSGENWYFFPSEQVSPRQK